MNPNPSDTNQILTSLYNSVNEHIMLIQASRSTLDDKYLDNSLAMLIQMATNLMKCTNNINNFYFNENVSDITQGINDVNINN